MRAALIALAVCWGAGVAHGTPATFGAARSSAVFDAARSSATFDAGRSSLLPLRAAESDTTLEQFLGGLSDSTNAYFGVTAAPLDTTGLDSATVANHGRSHLSGGRRGPHYDAVPLFRFNRVDGPVYGGALGLEPAHGLGRFSGSALYVVGPNVWQWTAGWKRRWGGFESGTTLELLGGKETSTMDRLLPVSVGDALSTLGALLRGYDPRDFLGRDGWTASLTHESGEWRAGLGWRDAVESAMVTTTSWNLANRTLDPFDNAIAEHGRAREALAALAGRVATLPLHFEGSYRLSSPKLGSDFDYTVARLALGAELALGRSSALVPQLAFGKLSGDTPPQESFYLGGTGSITTLRAERLAGSQSVLGRLDWIGTRDLLELAHIPHPAYLPLQGNLFAASGAVSGADPFGGPNRPDLWSTPSAWHSEAGIALNWQPGLPDPTSVARLSLAWPLGAGQLPARVTLTFTRILFMLEPSTP